MKRVVTCIAASATVATTSATPVVADDAVDALRPFGSLVQERERERRYSALHYYHDDDGRFHRGHVRTYHDDDDDDGRRRGQGRRWNDDDD